MRAYKRKPEPLGSNCEPASDFGVHMTSLKWGKLDLCLGWYCLTSYLGLELEKTQYKEISKDQCVIFLRRGESWDSLLEINTDPTIATGQFKSRSICVSVTKNYSHILLLSLFSNLSGINSLFYEWLINFSCYYFSLQRTTQCAPQQQEIATRDCHWLDRLCLLASPHHSSSQMACRQ